MHCALARSIPEKVAKNIWHYVFLGTKLVETECK
jgi:hypothetical protein